MTEALALELGPLGIRANAIGPGAIDTPMAASLHENEQVMQATLAQIPAGRIGQPQDIGARQFT